MTRQYARTMGDRKDKCGEDVSFTVHPLRLFLQIETIFYPLLGTIPTDGRGRPSLQRKQHVGGAFRPPKRSGVYFWIIIQFV